MTDPIEQAFERIRAEAMRRNGSVPDLNKNDAFRRPPAPKGGVEKRKKAVQAA